MCPSLTVFASENDYPDIEENKEIVLNIGVDIMEIKYKNTVEDVEFLLSYYSAKFLKYYFYPLYFVSLPVTWSLLLVT